MISIRPPRSDDETAIRSLLEQLGYPVTVDELQRRLTLLADAMNDVVLVADVDGQIGGLAALHWTPMLFTNAPVARITTLVVHESARGKGIGRQLIEAAAERAKQAGCEALEVTTGLDRDRAKAFYEAIGFKPTSWRLSRPVVLT